MAEGHEVIEITVGDGDLEASVSKVNVKVEKKKNEKKIDPGSGFTCKLCLDEMPSENKFTMESCGCFFCLMCMKSYVEVLIKDGVVLHIPCPDSECVIQGTLKVQEIRALARAETFLKYLKLKCEQEVSIDPLLTFCPNAECSSICHISLQQENEQQTKNKREKSKHKTTTTTQQPVCVLCPSCQLNFCHICKTEWTDNHKCIDLSETVGNEWLKLQTRTGLTLTSHADAIIKRCPVCNVLIEKDRGCAQMICKNCSHVFCWYCLKLLDNDFMLRHYDNGPCKNFLGHSRAQVFRHRMGVIGLFAAFTLLLIVASPILLLAAPVFLCCKWKECCERAIRRAQQENNNSLYNETNREKFEKRSQLRVVSEVDSVTQRIDEDPSPERVISVSPDEVFPPEPDDDSPVVQTSL